MKQVGMDGGAPTEEEVTLLGLWVSPFVRRVEWALHLKGIPYAYVEQDIIDKSPLLLRLNPLLKTVPVLVHRGNPLPESLIILEYLDEAFPGKGPSILPRDPLCRAEARFWAKFPEEKLLDNAWIAMTTDGEEKEMALKSASVVMEKIEERLKGVVNFCGGDEVGFADLAWGWIAHWLPVWDEVGGTSILNEGKHPATLAWARRFTGHPVIKENLPPRDKTLTYYTEKRKRIMALKA
ncbi:hypothetical protein MLD38_018108 [Melastoma candidum]|uniref:Uncharacterized protein n=1 Tax=Melastoma candidum TaxID=119954 RepID=A0ACB9QWA9_9MYRT|nr:hypothetical protein MLD38_018108 [Melastoma candidum]